MSFIQKIVDLFKSHPKSESAPLAHRYHFHSTALKREVVFDVYLPAGYDENSDRKYPLALFNDGQDLPRMRFERILETRAAHQACPSIIAVGIHCSDKRIREYGTMREADYKGRGDLAPQYGRFLLEEFMPRLRRQFQVSNEAKDTAFAGFSLGGLSALDLVWEHPEVFGITGVFSGSLWWRSSPVHPEEPDAHRIMHDIIAQRSVVDKNQRFWFQCGTLDEKEDRNNNGVIDSIDDTLDLIQTLKSRGIPETNIRYLEIENGLHEPKTWGEAMPDFLGWAFG